MDIVDVDEFKGTKSKSIIVHGVTADKKVKARTLLSPPASIISYLKPLTLPEMNKHLHKDHDIGASDSQREKSRVEQSEKTNLQPDCCREGVSCTQQPNDCKDSNYHVCSSETLSVESKNDCFTTGDQTVQLSKHSDNENKCKEREDCHVHRHDNDLQGVVSHHSDSNCIEDDDTSSCKHLDEVLTEDVHVVDCSDDDDDRSCTTSLKLPVHKPQPTKSKWNFTWKTTKKCSKVPKPQSSDDDSNSEEHVDLAAVHNKIDSQKTVHPATVEKKCINRSKAKTKNMNNSTKTASKDQNVISINNLESTECSDATDNINTSGAVIISGGLVGHGEHTPEPKQTLSNNDINGCINDVGDPENILSDTPAPSTPKVGENSCDIKADIESDSCKFQKGRKSFFDVLMRSSRDRTSTKQTSPENFCEKSEMDLPTSEEVEIKIVEVKRKDFKKSARGKKSDVRSVAENCKKDGLKGSNTSHKKLQAKGKSCQAQNVSEMIEDENECCGIGAKHVRRQSSRISAKATRNGKLDLEILHQSSPESKILRKRRKRKEPCTEAHTIPVHTADKNSGAKKQSESNLSSQSNKDQINPLTQGETQGIEVDVKCGDKNKSDNVRNKHVAKKATGPIAPIFLAGAWRRGLKKVEQEQLQESLVEVDEMSDTTASFEEKNDILKPKSNIVYSPVKDVSQRMQEFMGMFKKSPTKSNVSVVQLFDAPFPKVSHVPQVDNALQQKWDLQTFNGRFVKEEFFSSTDENYDNNVKVMSLSELLLNKVNTSQEKAFNWKGSQAKNVMRMSKVEKKAAVACLAKVYSGVSVKKLFKRCHLQLERCKKAELEAGNTDRHFVDRRNVEAQLSSKNDESRQSVSERKTFTQISEKKSCTATKGKKINKEKESPLLMAFRKQSQRNKSSCSEEHAKISYVNKKKQLPKGSLRHYFVLPQKIIDESSRNPVTEQVLGKSSRSKRKHGEEESNVCRRKGNSDVKESIVEETKKRQRESQEPVENVDEIVVDSVGPSKKKVKVMIDGQDSKQQKKGEKWKQNGGKTVESSKDVSQDKTKSPKISSDEDFVKTSKRGNRCTARDVKGTKRTSRDSGEAEQNGVRKSRRLQTKLATKEESEKELETDEKEIVEEQEVPGLKITRTEEKEVNIVSVVSHVEKQPSNETWCETQDDNIGVGQSPCPHVLASPPVLWTECFKPVKSEEILGYNSGGSKLKKWLSEWKSLREKKLNKMQRLQEKKNERLAARENGSNEWWYEDDEDEDFDFSDDSDGSDEEDILCNTMLLTGPTGCGKTSAVYACAEELGFKVIEVNSSSKRGGKYILSELQEATQSYQVAGSKRATDCIFPPISTATARCNDCDISKRGNENVKKGRKGRQVKKKENAKEKLQEESQLAGTPEGQMSLILLDEVDILFEEDKGFWVAVNSIRLNSKRPIVMTASDPCINIDGRFEHIIKSPSLIKVRAAHLQNVCLSKDVFVNPDEVQALAMLHHGDVRQSLLSLQFWVDSYAGQCDPHGTRFKTETQIYSHIPKISDKKVSSLGRANNERDNNTALSKRPFAKDLQKPEHSKELSTATEGHDTTDTQMSEVQQDDVAPFHNVNFLVHHLCVESLLGLRNVASAGEGALKVLSLRGEEDMLQAKHSFVCKSSVTSHCQGLGFDIARCNLETLLPCLFAWDSIGDNNCTKVTKVGQEQSTLKVGQINENKDDKGRSEDLLEKFQGDESVFDDERDERQQATCELDPTKQHSSAVAGECSTVEPEVETKNQHKKHGIRKKLGTISLEAFNHFLDDMSFLDSDLCCDVEAELRKREGRFGNQHAQVIPGVEDKVDTESARLTCKSRATLEEMRGTLEVASLQNSHQLFHGSIEKAGPEFIANSVDLISEIGGTESKLCPAFEIKKLEDGDTNSSMQLFTSGEIFMSKTKRRREQDLSTVTRHLPDTNQLNMCTLAMDYLPTLRNICRNENNRKASRTKRRFYHYFDMVGLNVPQSTIQLLMDDPLSKCCQDMK